MSGPRAHHLESTYIRLRGDASTELLPVDDTFWERIARGELGSFHGEFLIASNNFSEDWSVWEMHPHGDELVCLVSGAVTFVLDIEGIERTVTLDRAGAYVLVPQGTWHTARTSTSSCMIFVTPGEGTQHRPLAK
jgi:mannose-6-phosphate isomerase-like protein (cupin superfamily)